MRHDIFSELPFAWRKNKHAQKLLANAIPLSQVKHLFSNFIKPEGRHQQ